MPKSIAESFLGADLIEVFVAFVYVWWKFSSFQSTDIRTFQSIRNKLSTSVSLLVRQETRYVMATGFGACGHHTGDGTQCHGHASNLFLCDCYRYKPFRSFTHTVVSLESSPCSARKPLTWIRSVGVSVVFHARIPSKSLTLNVCSFSLFLVCVNIYLWFDHLITKIDLVAFNQVLISACVQMSESLLRSMLSLHLMVASPLGSTFVVSGYVCQSNKL